MLESYGYIDLCARRFFAGLVTIHYPCGSQPFQTRGPPLNVFGIFLLMIFFAYFFLSNENFCYFRRFRPVILFFSADLHVKFNLKHSTNIKQFNVTNKTLLGALLADHQGTTALSRLEKYAETREGSYLE